MIRCLVFSDSHGERRNILEAMRRFPNPDCILFLGDGLSDVQNLPAAATPYMLTAVRGNCDFTSTLDGAPVRKIETLFLEGHTIVMTHGDLFGAKYGFDELASLARDHAADVVLFGHTHRPTEYYIPFDEKPGGVHFFNPGSIGDPPDGEPTFGVLTLDGDSVLFSHGTL